MDKIYYVYVFYNSLTPIYVGYGKNQRWKDHFSMGTNLRLNRYLKKNPNTVPKFIALELSCLDAKQLEIDLIAKFGRLDKKTGSLYNLTDGGDGTSGFKMSEQTKYHLASCRKIRWADPNNREAHSKIMSIVTNSLEFKTRVLERRPKDWIPAKQKRRNEKILQKKQKLQEVKKMWDDRKIEELLNFLKIKTRNGLNRFLKRNGIIDE